MRIPIVRRIPENYAAMTICSLAALQLASGTEVKFSIFVALYIIFYVLTFNILGGMTSPCAIIITHMALTNVLISQFVKILLWQPAHLHLQSASETIAIQSIGMACVYIAANLTTKFSTKIKNLQKYSKEPRSYRLLSLTALSFYLMTILLLFMFPEIGNSQAVSGIIQYLSFIPNFIIICEILFSIKRSAGARSTTWILYGVVISIWIPAVFGFWKQQFFYAYLGLPRHLPGI